MSQQQPQQPPQQPQQQSPTGDWASPLCGLEAAMASTGITSRDEAAGPGTIAKGPTKTNDYESKSEGRLHKPMQTPPTGGTNVHIPASLPPGYLPQPQPPLQPRRPIVSPVSWSPMSQPQPQPQPQPFHQPDWRETRGPIENEVDILEQLLEQNGDYGGSATGNQGGLLPSGIDEVFITPPPAPQSTMPLPPPPPPPLPPPPPQLPQQPQTSNAAVPRTGRPVSEETRRKLIDRLRPQTVMVDENFNTPLHNAVLQNEPKELIDFLLSDLKSKKKLSTVINLVNGTGHTPLSLCLKSRRPDLVPMLLLYDAAPTQLCGSASERTNHFHYAMCKCLDSRESLQLVKVFINAVCKHCPMDLFGMQSKNRVGKTAMDLLLLRISQLSNHQDPASAELLTMLQSLYAWLNKQLDMPY